MLHERFEHQNAANTMGNERFEFKHVANTVEMAASSSKCCLNRMENGQNWKIFGKTRVFPKEFWVNFLGIQLSRGCYPMTYPRNMVSKPLPFLLVFDPPFLFPTVQVYLDLVYGERCISSYLNVTLGMQRVARPGNFGT